MLKLIAEQPIAIKYSTFTQYSNAGHLWIRSESLIQLSVVLWSHVYNYNLPRTDHMGKYLSIHTYEFIEPLEHQYTDVILKKQSIE